ncbi:MAG: energy-coupling factor ABC transporter ATP-binding protein [Desulfobacterales bacterium]|jgi:tungstate transport system ATP-binding protein|nr:energy-coupling factor ABC transporter ATP-binding protein [Desulfobacterales bacterium]
MAAPIYQINDLEHVYGNKPVLQIDRLALLRGAIVGLSGPNGSGKSTLLKLLGLIEKPTTGRILYNGFPVEPFSGHARFQITLLPQEPVLMKRSVFKNVAYGLKLRGEKEPFAEAVKKALLRVGLSYNGFAQRPWYALSGGEAQRVAMAARLALKPKVLLLDEPTAAIDAASAQLIKEAAFNARKAWGTTLVIASHDQPWLSEVCDDVLPLFKGRVMDQDYHNIVFGPWTDLGHGNTGKRLSDGQEIRTPQPPHPDAAAVMTVMLSNEFSSAQEPHLLQGVISRLHLERKTGKINVVMVAGNLALNLKVSPEKIREKAIFPGKAVSVYYDRNRISWR